MNERLTSFEADVLAHTSQTGRYVTAEPRVLALAERGLLRDHGAQSLAAGDHYLTMSEKGREALAAWRAGQPKPPKRKRQSKAFEAWGRYSEAFGRIAFPAFLKLDWRRL